jgi:hypothetical protein
MSKVFLVRKYSNAMIMNTIDVDMAKNVLILLRRLNTAQMFTKHAYRGINLKEK